MRKITTARLKKARDRRVALLLGIIQDVARDTLKRVMANRSTTITPSAPQRRVVRVEGWRLHTCKGTKSVTGFVSGHTHYDEGNWAKMRLPHSVDAQKVCCGYSFHTRSHLYILDKTTDDIEQEILPR